MLRAPMSLEKMSYDAHHRYRPLPLEDAPGPEEKFPGDARCRVAGAATSPHPRSLRAPGALRGLVVEPRARRAGEGSEGSGGADHVRSAHRTPERVRLACQGPREGKGPLPSLGARLIRKVYEADPLECPKCKGPMRVIALIDDPPVVRRILEHLGRWAPEAAGPDSGRSRQRALHLGRSHAQNARMHQSRSPRTGARPTRAAQYVKRAGLICLSVHVRPCRDQG